MLFIFSTQVLIIHLWQLKTVVFLHWCLMHIVLLDCTVLLKFDLNAQQIKQNKTLGCNFRHDTIYYNHCHILETYWCPTGACSIKLFTALICGFSQ